MGQIIEILIIVLVILLVIFLIFREFFCWYWKINKRNELLKEIRDILRHNIPEKIAKEIKKKYSDKEETNDKKSYFSENENEEDYWPK